VETLSGDVLADASGLYVQPKYAAAMLDTDAIKLAMGVPEHEGRGPA
jgi:hypothetical protein